MLNFTILDNDSLIIIITYTPTNGSSKELDILYAHWQI